MSILRKTLKKWLNPPALKGSMVRFWRYSGAEAPAMQQFTAVAVNDRIFHVL
jgi:hypothetical protein